MDNISCCNLNKENLVKEVMKDRRKIVREEKAKKRIEEQVRKAQNVQKSLQLKV